jgi:hypothetical protein
MALDGTLPEGATPNGGQTAPKGRAVDLPVGVFRDKTLREAITILLEAGRRKQTNKEIADGLKKGGIPTTSANFEPTVATALHRMRADGIVLRFDDGWDLASSYPDNLRNRLQSKEKPRKAKKGERKNRKAKNQKAKAQVGPKAVELAQPKLLVG